MKKKRVRLLMLMWLMAVSAFCRAEGHCAWLNDATASGLLNGIVTLDLQTAADDQNICVFTYQRSAIDYASLRIMVQPLKNTADAIKSHESLCTSVAVSLKAVGNEAASCSADVGYSRGEQVIGRVRDRLFVVTVSSTAGQDPAMTRPLLKDKARSIAEQVAGALF